MARSERERDLCRAYHQGDATALRELLRLHQNAVYTHCIRMLGGHQEAADVCQDTCLRCLERSGRYDPERPFRPWILGIAANLCKDRLSTVWWKRVIGLDAQPEVGGPDPEQLLHSFERDRMVRQALLRLPVLYREAVSLFHLEGLTYRQMAEITGATVPALKQRVRRGCAMLRSTVEDMYPEFAQNRTA